jgi:non-ribosomal peptide synthetase component F
MRVKLRGTDTAEQLLAQVRQTVIEGQSHQDCPFERMVVELNPRRGEARNPLYNVGLLWHGYPAANFRSPGLQTTGIPAPPIQALLDLQVEVEPVGFEWLVVCEYAGCVFPRNAAAGFLVLFARCIDALILNPNSRLDGLGPEARCAGGRF